MDLISDPVEARRRIDRFVERAARRDAYGELLARGDVRRVVSDPEAREALRKQLRRQARADRLRIMTRAYGDVVWASLNRADSGDREQEALAHLGGAYAERGVAELLGHQRRVLAREPEESIAHCSKCGALGHSEGAGVAQRLAGALYTEPCTSAAAASGAERSLGDVAKKFREVRQALVDSGWTRVRQTGSHEIWQNADGSLTVTVAGKGSDTVPPGTLSAMRRATGLELR